MSATDRKDKSGACESRRDRRDAPAPDISKAEVRKQKAVISELLTQSVSPIPGSAVQVHHGNHEDSRFQDLIDDAVGKSSRLAAMAVLSKAGKRSEIL